MKILLLTPVDPVNSAIYYNELLEHLKDYKVDIVSIPFFAETHARMKEQLYLPTLFSFWHVLKNDKKVKRKVYKGNNLLVIGNSYKEHEFDMIISLGEEAENEYINFIRDSEQFKDTKLKEEVKKLYKWEEAETNLPTIEHAKKFLEGAYKKNE